MLVAALVAVDNFALAVGVAAPVAVLGVLPVVFVVLVLPAHLPLQVVPHNFRRTLRLARQGYRTLHIWFRPRISPPSVFNVLKAPSKINALEYSRREGWLNYSYLRVP
jgi:hypothetical protein